MCRPTKITGTFEPLWGESTGEHTGAFSVGDITHYSNIRFVEMRCVPVLPRTIYKLELGETIKLPELKKYNEEKDNGKSQ